MQPQNILTLASMELGKSQEFNAFEIVLVGFLFVFCILVILTLATTIMGKIFARMPVKEVSVPAKAAIKDTSEQSKPLPATAANDSDSEENDPRYISVIAAAIHCALDGRKYRMVSIRPGNSNWAAEGRREIFSSHNVR